MRFKLKFDLERFFMLDFTLISLLSVAVVAGFIFASDFLFLSF